MTTKTPNRLARMADERRNTLKLLAQSANLSHRWAAASAGAAIAHMVAAGHALVQARDLCEEGGWLRWLRKSFEGSIRTAQRYMRIARHLPESGIDATRVSHRSQTAVLRAIRGVVFATPGGAAGGAPCCADSGLECADDATAHRRLAFIAARRMRKLAAVFSATGGDHAPELAERINALATDLLLDVGVCRSSTDDVYFIEAVGADRVKIGVSRNVEQRFSQLAASFPGPLKLLGAVSGGRAREASLHKRLANFHIGGEWFHLTSGVRAAVAAVIADQPE
jgi:hypothetical protein